MPKHLNISQILIYYDLPELFIATDEVGTSFICLLSDFTNNIPLFYSTPISRKRISKFIQGKVELYDLLKEPEINEWYYFHLEAEKISAERIEIDQFPENLLPERGFYVNKEIISNEIIVNEVTEKDNAVVHIAVSDGNDDFAIDTDNLGDILKLYTVILENSYKKSISEHNFKQKKAFIIEDNYKMRAFASSRSSFNIHLYSQSNKDLFGNCMIEFGLEKIDQLFSEHANEDQLIETLKSLKGHTISSFKKLLKKIIDKNLKVKHKWFAPNQKDVHFKVLNKQDAIIIYDLLNLSTELEEEIKEFIGVFVQADVERGTWRIKNLSDKKEFSGDATLEQLKGITLDTVKYKLTCQEIIEEFRISEKEKTKYIFKSIMLADK